ncbi:MAG: hypothetical protein IIW01_06915, partial [Thermoguttaceae bacterium]|nr:hypothetical protein [Thermoguttaceae bacterium]
MTEKNDKRISELDKKYDDMYEAIFNKSETAQSNFDESFTQQINRYSETYEAKLVSLQNAYDSKFNELKDDYTNNLTNIDNE